MKSDFTFAVCAYGDSPYLEEALLSAMHQTVPVEILIATSTPSEYIRNIAEKYGIPYFVNPEKKGIASDWNFALSRIRTEYGMILHQDDIYFPHYAEHVLSAMRKYPDSLIAFTDYGDLTGDGKIHAMRLYLWVKRILLWSFYLKHAHRSSFWKRSALIFGNAICCPAVAYHLTRIRNSAFDTSYTVNLDWAMWLALARQEGAFIFIPRVLMAHRISDTMETAAAVADHRRYQEDLRIFRKIWGEIGASLIMKLYQLAYPSRITSGKFHTF